MLLGGVKFLVGGAWALLTISTFGKLDSNNTYTVYNLLLITVLVAGGIAYALVQIRDFKPNSRLRRDNADLRADNDDLQKRLDHSAREAETLRKSRDFEQALAGTVQAIGEARAEATAEAARIIAAIEQNTQAVNRLAAAHEKEAS